MQTDQKNSLASALGLKSRTLSYGRPEDSTDSVAARQWILGGTAPTGRAVRITLRHGFDLSAYDIVAQARIEALSTSDPCLALVVILDGESEGRLSPDTGSSTLDYRGGQCFLSHVRAPAKGGIGMAPGHSFRLIDVRLAANFLSCLDLDGFLANLVPDHSLHVFSDDTFWLGGVNAPAELYRTAAWLFEEAFSERPADIRVERAGLDMVDMALNLFGCAGGKKSAALSPTDTARVRRLEAMMAGELARRWTVRELARTAGVSERRLHDLFHLAFDRPVYAHLQRMRLDRARALIETDGYSVTSAALSVGYDSPSHLAALFKREFGIAPSTLRRVVRASSRRMS